MRAVLLSALICSIGAAATSETVLKPFEERLSAYVKLRKQAVGNVPAADKKAEPEEIQRRETALAQAIRKARPDAKPGDLLSADVKPVFSRLLRGVLTGKGSTKTRASIKEGNPTNERTPGEVVPVIEVNGVYPKNAPLSTIPPTLLLTLPKLPKELEYRFVGRTLVLLDRDANLIVDYMKEAVPAV